MRRSASSSHFRLARLGAAVSALVFGALITASACGGGGSLGYECRFNEDCGDGFCCESPQCAHGMCTYDCRDDRDCPSDMGCDHDVCFFRCAGDVDCPLPFHCEHKHSLCEA